MSEPTFEKNYKIYNEMHIENQSNLRTSPCIVYNQQVRIQKCLIVFFSHFLLEKRNKKKI